MKRKTNRLIAIVLAVVTLISAMLVGVTAAAKPATPKTTTENALGGVLVKWNKVDSAVKYNIYRRQAGSSVWYIVGTTTGTSLLDNGVESGVYYAYSVRAYNNAGLYSDYIYGNTQSRKYMAVPKLTGISNSNNGLYIKWDDVAGVTNGYRVYRRGAGATYWTYLCTTKNLYYTDSSVKNLSGDYFRYTVIADGGYHSKFDTAGLWLKRLATPDNIKMYNVVNGLKVTWRAVKGAYNYNIYRKAAGEQSWTYAGTSRTAEFVDENVDMDQYYTYTVRAVSGDSISYFTSLAPVTKVVRTPYIVGYETAPEGILIAWNGSASNYTIYRRDQGTGWIQYSSTYENYFVDTDVQKGKYYCYTVRGIVGNVQSGYDNEGCKIYYSGKDQVVILENVKNNPLLMYQKAAAEIKSKGVAGYTTKKWQNLVTESSYASPAAARDVLIEAMDNYAVNKDDAVAKVCAKGSNDSKQYMPISSCSADVITDAYAVKKGNNYQVTIFLKDQVNPKRADKDGLNVMSNNLLFVEDAPGIAKNDPNFSQIVTQYSSGTISYTNIKIVATMTPDGKFVDIKQYADVTCSFKGSLKDFGASNVSYTFKLGQEYSNFKY